MREGNWNDTQKSLGLIVAPEPTYVIARRTPSEHTTGVRNYRNSLIHGVELYVGGKERGLS